MNLLFAIDVYIDDLSLVFDNYNVSGVTFTSVKSSDDFKYICKTCDSKIKKNKIPCHA